MEWKIVCVKIEEYCHSRKQKTMQETVKSGYSCVEYVNCVPCEQSSPTAYYSLINREINCRMIVLLMVDENSMSILHVLSVTTSICYYNHPKLDHEISSVAYESCKYWLPSP